MSYILDALKRADAERERGAAPGLHTRHQVSEGTPGTTSTRRNISLALAGGLLLILLALFFWVTRTPDALPAASALAPLALPAPPAPSTPATLPAPVPMPVPVAASAVLAEAPKIKALPEPSAAKPPTAPDAKPVSQTAAPATAPKAALAAAPKPPLAAVPLLAELPQDLRSQIPKITITGSVYSDSPAQRLLLINNVVLPQGSQVDAELKLEEIQPRSSVFSFKGSRFRVMH